MPFCIVRIAQRIEQSDVRYGPCKLEQNKRCIKYQVLYLRGYFMPFYKNDISRLVLPIKHHLIDEGSTTVV